MLWSAKAITFVTRYLLVVPDMNELDSFTLSLAVAHSLEPISCYCNPTDGQRGLAAGRPNGHELSLGETLDLSTACVGSAPTGVGEPGCHEISATNEPADDMWMGLNSWQDLWADMECVDGRQEWG